MTDQTKAELMMRFVLKPTATQAGGDVYAESASDIVPDDPFMEGFQAADYDDYSNFFDVQSFDFSMAVKPQDDGVGALSNAGRGNGAHGHGGVPVAHDQFSRWRSATEHEYSKIKFPIEFDSFSFTRVIDGASPIFFSACVNQNSFRSATLVKRIASVRTSDGQRLSLGYLRFEFHDVLLTSFAWTDGDLVTETCSFICKKMTIKYRRQRPDSSLASPIQPIEWDQKKNGEAGGHR